MGQYLDQNGPDDSHKLMLNLLESRYSIEYLQPLVEEFENPYLLNN